MPFDILELKKEVEGLELEHGKFYTKKNKSAAKRSRKHSMTIIHMLKSFRVEILKDKKDLPVKSKKKSKAEAKA